MKAILFRINNKLYFFDVHEKKPGKNDFMSGDCTGLRGDCTGLCGDCTELRGDCTGLSGDLDECEISPGERSNGINLLFLVEK